MTIFIDKPMYVKYIHIRQ